MRQRARALLCGIWFAAASCRQIIGIEQAEVDPSLAGEDAGGLGGSGNVVGAGGSAAGEAAEQGGAAGIGLGGEAAAGEAGRTSEAAGSGAGGEAGGSSMPTLCERYCSTVTEHCTGSFAVYTSYGTCLAVCDRLPEGTEGARTGNSLQCRLGAAQSAKGEVPHYCPIAGPGGNGVCGTNCESLCSLRARVCAGFSAGDLESCSSECAKLQDLGNYSTDLDVGQYAGPHVQCRLYHLSAAAADDPEQHCSHVDGAAPCD